MKIRQFLSCFLLGGLLAPAAEEMEQSLIPYIRNIRSHDMRSWTPEKAIQALGNLPGAPSQATFDMLKNTWKQPGSYKRIDFQHKQMKQLIKDGKTTDMNTYLLILSNRLLLRYVSQQDRDLYVNHMLKTYEQEKPQEEQHQLNWLGSLCFVGDFYAEHMLGILGSLRGEPAMLTEHKYQLHNMYQKRAAESNRLWTSPHDNAAYLRAHANSFNKSRLRYLLHDHTVHYDYAARRGLTNWHYPWGKDLPMPLALGLQLMKGRSQGQLPPTPALQQIQASANTLPAEMKGFIVRNLLAAAPDYTPWKKLDDPTADISEMPDCTAVNLPQWNAELMGPATTAAQDIAALEKLVKQEQNAKTLSSLVLFTLAQDARAREDSIFRDGIPTQGHFNYYADYDIEVSENGIDILINDDGPAFEKDDAALRTRCRNLNIALHRCALQLALLERDGKLNEHKKAATELATVLNQHRLWPLLMSEYSMRHLGPETCVQLLDACRADSNILYHLGRLFTRSSISIIHDMAGILTKRTDEDGKPDPEQELLAPLLRDHFINAGVLPHTPEQLADVQRRWQQIDDMAPDKITAVRLLKVGRMNAGMYRTDLAPERISGKWSIRGYHLVRHALQQGDTPAAEKLLASMCHSPQMYSYPGTRLAMALVARAKGDEAKALEQERLAVTLAAISLNSSHFYYWEDAVRLLLEHGMTREVEKLLTILPNHGMPFLRRALIQRLAEQRRFRSAAFWQELAVADFCSKATPAHGLGTQAELACWRIKADAYHALALLQQNQASEPAKTLLEHTMKQLERMPALAAELAPFILTCADIATGTRQDYQRRLLAGSAGNAIALAKLQAVQLENLSTEDESADIVALNQASPITAPAPFHSELYTWHLQKADADEAADTGNDERTATRSTIQARIVNACYDNPHQAPWVLLQTDAGRKRYIKLDELSPDDVQNLIDWKEKNHIRTWAFTEKKTLVTRPFEARFERLVQNPPSQCLHVRDGVDVSNGLTAEFTTTHGNSVTWYLNQLDDEARQYIQQNASAEKPELRIHTTLAAAETEAAQRRQPIIAFMLGQRSGPEENLLHEQLAGSSKDLPTNYVLLVCYKDDEGNWETPGRQVLNIIGETAAILEPAGTPENERVLDGGFQVTLNHVPTFVFHSFRSPLQNSPEYKALTAAIRSNNEAEVNRLLDANPDLLHVRTNEYACCPLQTAIKFNSSDSMVELLVKRGASLNTRDWRGDTLLQSCINSKDEKHFRQLLKLGADPNLPSIDINMKDALYPVFSAMRQPQLLPPLLEAGANLNVLMPNGENALFELMKQSPKADVALLAKQAELLIPSGMNINTRNKMGESLLWKLAQHANCSDVKNNPQELKTTLETMRLFIRLGADVQETRDGTPSLLSRLRGQYGWAPPLNPEVEKLLLEHGAK